MKKFISAFTAIIITMGITISAAAQSLGCEVSVKDVTVQQKGQVTIPVEISSNNGFTNAAILLDYDRQQLELVSINTKDAKLLCGDLTSVNIKWTDGENNYGYIVIASEEAIDTDGELFTATFNMKDEFAEQATVTPIVKYMRNNTALFSVFKNIETTAQAGVIVKDAEASVPETVRGDFDGDGAITMLDVADAFEAYMNEDEINETQKQAADFNGNGVIDMLEVAELFDIYMNA